MKHIGWIFSAGLLMSKTLPLVWEKGKMINVCTVEVAFGGKRRSSSSLRKTEINRLMPTHTGPRFLREDSGVLPSICFDHQIVSDIFNDKDIA